jgi:S-formylglutathione hydrolase FrmB
MKSWLDQGRVDEMILVMPNSHSRLQGSWYTNSETTGNWADYIATDLVDYIDDNYRTLAQRESRAVIGHSMGGYGGFKLGLLYPEVFGCMGGMAGVYDYQLRMETFQWSYAVVSTLEDWQQFYALDWITKMFVSECAAYASNLNRLPFYCDSPFEFTEGKPKKTVRKQEVYDRFMEHNPLTMVDHYIASLLDMRAIYLDCGTGDGLITHARKLHDKLQDLGIEHVYEEFAGDHTCCVMTSTGDALEVFSNAMAFEMLVSVESMGKLASTWGRMKKYE